MLPVVPPSAASKIMLCGLIACAHASLTFPPVVKTPPAKRVPTPETTSVVPETTKFDAARVAADSEYNNEDTVAFFDN